MTSLGCSRYPPLFTPNPSLNPVTFITKFHLNPPMILHDHNSRLSYIISHLNFWNTPLLGLLPLVFSHPKQQFKTLNMLVLTAPWSLAGAILAWSDTAYLSTVQLALCTLVLPASVPTHILLFLAWNDLTSRLDLNVIHFSSETTATSHLLTCYWTLSFSLITTITIYYMFVGVII